MRPNFSIERTSSGKLRLPAAAAHVKRMTEVVVDRPSMRGFEGMPSTPALSSAALTPVASAEVPA